MDKEKPIDLKKLGKNILNEWRARKMGKPRNILEKKEQKGLGKTYYGCPWCFRFVARKRGLQQCAKCGGMVDNDKTDPWPAKTKMKFDGKESWR